MAEYDDCAEKAMNQIVEEGEVDLLGKKVFVKDEPLISTYECKKSGCSGFCLVEAVVGKDNTYVEVKGKFIGKCIEGK